MYNLLDMELIKYRDISEDTCMLIDEKVITFSKAVRRVLREHFVPVIPRIKCSSKQKKSIRTSPTTEGGTARVFDFYYVRDLEMTRRMTHEQKCTFGKLLA